VANVLYRRLKPADSDPFVLSIISARGQTQVRCAGDLILSGITAEPAKLDCLIVPGLEYHSPSAIVPMVRGMQPELALLQRLAAAQTPICASCSGTFLLAASGVLDGAKATTSWWLAPTFAREFPGILLDARALHVQSKHIATAGAVTAMFTLVLRVIEQHLGVEFAQNTARILLVDIERQSQSAYVSEALIPRQRSSFSERAEQYLQAHLSESSLSIEQLAQHCSMSARSLIRHFQQTFHKSPQVFLQHLRIERAKVLLETSGLSLPELVEQVGYSDVASFRKLFKRLSTLTPAEYRARFRLRGR
jgi:transcriptional regulator GlxA family with amidase domain